MMMQVAWSEGLFVAGRPAAPVHHVHGGVLELEVRQRQRELGREQHGRR